MIAHVLFKKKFDLKNTFSILAINVKTKMSNIRFGSCQWSDRHLLNYHLLNTDVMGDLYNYYNPKTNSPCPMISKETFDIITENADVLNSAVLYERDYNYSYFGFKVIELMHSVILDTSVKFCFEIMDRYIIS